MSPDQKLRLKAQIQKLSQDLTKNTIQVHEIKKGRPQLGGPTLPRAALKEHTHLRI